MDIEEMKAWREERGREWNHGFTLFGDQMIPTEPSELCFVSDPEWEALREAVSRGFTIGIIVPGDDPGAVLAEIANRLSLPIRAFYDEPDNMLYVAAKERTWPPRQTADAKGKQRKRRSA